MKLFRNILGLVRDVLGVALLIVKIIAYILIIAGGATNYHAQHLHT